MSTTVKFFIVLNLALALAFTFVQMTLYATRENWKRRWNEETKFLADEVKAAGQKIAEESYAKIVSQGLATTLSAQIADLQIASKKQALPGGSPARKKQLYSRRYKKERRQS